MRFALVTGADDKYFSLLDNFLASLGALSTAIVPEVYVIDCGLTADQVRTLRVSGVSVLEAPAFPVPLSHAPEHYKAFTARPLLPKMIEADYIMWADADTWFQGPDVLVHYAEAASSSDLACVTEEDRNYTNFFMQNLRAPREFSETGGLIAYQDRRYSFYQRHFDDEQSEHLSAHPLINIGVFCARSSSIFWTLWEDKFTELLSKLGNDFMADPETRFLDQLADQTSANAVVRMHGLKANFLPAIYNWVCHRALPAFDSATNRYCEQHWPYAPLQLIHLTLSAAKVGAVEVPSVQKLRSGEWLLELHTLRYRN